LIWIKERGFEPGDRRIDPGASKPERNPSSCGSIPNLNGSICGSLRSTSCATATVLSIARLEVISRTVETLLGLVQDPKQSARRMVYRAADRRELLLTTYPLLLNR
jgi:hypothetical protein